MSRRAFALLATAALAGACGAEMESESEGVGGLVNGGGAFGGWTSTSTTTTTTTSTSTTTTSGTGGEGGGEGGAGGECVDIALGEPNETEETAYPIESESINDCDGSGDSFSGTIVGSEEDWFRYNGDDEIGCVVDPEVTFSTSSAARICMFFECFNGNTEVDCPGGTTAYTSPGGREGCCSPNSFAVTALDCSGSSDEYVRVYILVDDPNADEDTCIDYDVDYHY